MRNIPLIASALAAFVIAHPFHGWSREAAGTEHARVVKVTLSDGSSHVGRLEGVGCNVALCSRVAINGRLRFDRLGAIREVCDGRAQFVFADGTEESVSVIPDNRVFYLRMADGHRKKIQMHELKSLKFMPQESR